MKSIKQLIYILSFPFYGYCQEGETSCNYESFGEKRQVQDSINFCVYFGSSIDFSNEQCTFIVGEGYSNVVPEKNSQVLCVIYWEGKKPTNDLNYMDLFDNEATRAKFIDHVQLIYIYDTTTGFEKVYQEKNEIQTILQEQIRHGFTREEY